MFKPCCVKLQKSLMTYNLCDPDFYRVVDVESEEIDVEEEGTDEDAEPETEEEKAEREFSERQEAYENMNPLERFFADASEEMVTVQVPASALQAAVPAAEAEAPVEEAPADSVELIEDKAIAAVNSIQEAAQQAVELIQEAKQAPAPGTESDIQEAQFTDTDEGYQGAAKIFNDPMSAWLSQI
jgi:hypothetical protein